MCKALAGTKIYSVKYKRRTNLCVSQDKTPKGCIYPLTSSQLETTQQVRGFIDVQMQQMKWLV